MIVSPTAALMFAGENASTPVPPTTILWSIPVTVVVPVVVAAADVALAAEVAVEVAALLVDAVLFPNGLFAALDWNTPKLSPGFTAKTMPC